MSDGLSVHCVDTTDVVAVDTAHTKDVLSADATDFMSAYLCTMDHGAEAWVMVQKHDSWYNIKWQVAKHSFCLFFPRFTS